MAIINDVVDKVSVALYDAFGSGYTIYPEHINQGFKTPCFMIQVLETTTSPYIGGRFERTVPVVIRFVPVTDGRTKAMNDMADMMYECLEVIGSGNDLIRGRNLSSDFDEDGNLQFFVTYSQFFYKENTDDNMNELETEVMVED